MTALDAATIARLRAQAPRAFGAPPLVRAAHWGLGLAAMAYVVSLLGRLGLTPERFAASGERFALVLDGMLPPDDGGFLLTFLARIGETLAMALIGTLAAAAIALPLGFLGARTVVRHPAAHFLIRRAFDLFRGVPTLIWALIAVRATGLGPMAGILALIASDFAALAKLNAEAIEAADRGPIEGVKAAGASSLMTLRYGVAPQVAPVMISQALYAFESNVRNAAILGVVGAGGIGFDLQERIRINRWDQAAFIIILFLIAVALIDLVSGALRHALIGAAEPARARWRLPRGLVALLWRLTPTRRN